MFKKLIFLFLLSANILSAQKLWDSTYYVKYNSRLIVSLYQSYRHYETELSQFLTKDSLTKSKVLYYAQANNITGIELNYDKINFSFGFASIPPSDPKKTGKTDHFNIGLNVGGNKWILETNYRRYQGFYDKNTPKYDTAFTRPDSLHIDRKGVYTQFPHMTSTSYKMKFLFFTNSKRFSFKSGYSCSYRQIKSSFSWVITANGYYNTINNDSSMIPKQLYKFYDTHSSLKGLDVVGTSVYGGASFNLVLWRALFVNLTLLGGPQQQWRTYKNTGNDSLHYNRTTFYSSISGDFRASIGLNFKRWFVTLSSVNDFSWYKSNDVMMVSKYVQGQFALGYRFKVKTPKIYKKFQQTKLYSLM